MTVSAKTISALLGLASSSIAWAKSTKEVTHPPEATTSAKIVRHPAPSVFQLGMGVPPVLYSR